MVLAFKLKDLKTKKKKKTIAGSEKAGGFLEHYSNLNSCKINVWANNNEICILGKNYCVYYIFMSLIIFKFSETSQFFPRHTKLFLKMCES